MSDARWRWRALVLAGVSAVVLWLALTASGGPLTPAKAIALGAVEGATEYLPISSTGHLIVVQRLLGLGSDGDKVAADTYAVAVQLGAILAVVALYRRRLAQLARGALGRDRDGRELLTALVIAFVPSAVVGAAFGGWVKAQLFGPWPIVVAWSLGGVLLLRWRPPLGGSAIELIGPRAAAIVGCAQVVALWPGTSRSLVTIVAALFAGLTMTAAVEFSFLLGLATLSAATILDLSTDGKELFDEYGWRTPLLGGIVAFVSAVAAVRWPVGYLRSRSLVGFGWYRLAAAGTTVALLVGGVI